MTVYANPPRNRFVTFIRTPTGLTLAVITGVLSLCCLVGVIGSTLTTHSQPVPAVPPSGVDVAGTPAEPPSALAATTEPPVPPATTPAPPPGNPPAGGSQPGVPRTSTTKPKPPSTTTTHNGAFVHPGAFCSPAGATGVTDTGKPMVCRTTATDSRLRWRAA